jgi:acyl transferase domain-containing protein/SAM-dependent methyltransferase/acyl carrier protein
MSEQLPTTLSPLKRAYLALEQMQAKLEASERLRSEPIAIVGIGCRFPGNANDPEALWRLLRNGFDAITEVPPERWNVDDYYSADPETPGKIITRHGGFLQNVDRFDAEFFGISPREAFSLDPQQRLLLEVGWEALEHAGQVRDRLSENQTGVFIGITSHDYAQLLGTGGDVPELDAYHITGNALNAAAGRLSFALGFQGPSMAIDTACSSSLVAVHLACRSLSNRECSMALAGGVNLTLSPVASIALSKARVLSQSGQCKAFDAAADGMGRSEGCGVVVLKRLSDALRDGDNILASIAGSAINQDGPSSGLTVPNGPSQEALIRRALANAKITPAQVDYIEAHGTGTSLGDPVEFGALAAVFGKDRRSDSPLLIGSVKTNIGHSESAAGIAGLIKAVLAIQHAEIPPHLHFNQPSPHIRWTDLPAVVPTRLTPWPSSERKRIAGVSAFGFTGTNAHLVIQEAPPPSKASIDANPRSLQLFVLSGKTRQSLTDLAAQYETHLADHPNLSLEDICQTLSTGRCHFGHRLAIVARTFAELRTKLRAFVEGTDTQFSAGQFESKPRVAWHFSGEGSEYSGMGRELWETEPVFREAFDSCDAILRPFLGRSLAEIVYTSGGQSSLVDEIAYQGPALFSIEYALARLWLSWGVTPAALLGDGVGEYVAATVAGVFNLEDALKLVACEARLFLEDSPEAAIAACSGGLEKVVSGKRPSFEAGEFRQTAETVRYASPKIILIPAGKSQLAASDIATPGYWVQRVRRPVNHSDGLAALRSQGCDLFLEISPKPTLLQMLGSLSELYVSGTSVNWSAFARTGRRIPLPTYPFQRQRYWIPGVDTPPRRIAFPSESTPANSYHPLLGREVPLAGTREIRFQSSIGAKSPAFLQDHQVFQKIVLPATAYLEMALTAGSIALKSDQIQVADVTFQQPLFVPKDAETTVQLVLTPGEPDGYSFRIFSLTVHGGDWVLHSSGKVLLQEESSACDGSDLALLRRTFTESVSVDVHYEQCKARGIDLGPRFRGLRSLWRQDGQALGNIHLPPDPESLSSHFTFHPVLLDCCLHVLAAAGLEKGRDEVYLPLSLRGFRVFQRPDSCLWSHAQVRPVKSAHPLSITVDLQLFSEDGRLVAALDGFELKRANSESILRPAQRAWHDWLYEVEWQAQPSAAAAQTSANVPALRELCGDLRSAMSATLLEADQETYVEILGHLEDLSGLYIVEALRDLGWTFSAGQPFSTQSMAEQLGVVDRHRKQLDRFLEILAEDGILRKEDSQWEVVNPPPVRDLREDLTVFRDRFSGAGAELEMLVRCGSRLAEVLRGSCDPLELLFPQAEAITAASLYQNSPGAQAANAAIERVFTSYLESLPKGRPVRILEIGAGTGGTTAGLLPHLAMVQAEYVFTDLSSTFVHRAHEKFSDYRSVRYRVLDAEKPPSEQGFSGEQFDVVLAANVLHATRDLQESLRHVRQLLAPRGILVLLEGTSPLRFIDLIFGLTEGWWRFADRAVRPSHPLLPVSGWCPLLKRNGFQAAEAITSQEDRGFFSNQAIILAQAEESSPELAGKAPEHWIIFADKQGVGQRLAELCRSRVEVCTVITQSHQYAALCAADYSRLLGESTQNSVFPVRRVVHLWALDAGQAGTPNVATLRADSQLQCGSTLNLVQALVQEKLAEQFSLGLVTRGTQPVNDYWSTSGVVGSSLWGMGKAIALEHPELNCVRVDLDPQSTDVESDAQFVLNEMLARSAEDQIAFRGRGRYVPRLVRHRVFQAGGGAEIAFRADATYLITGGRSGLGMLAGQWMVEHGARQLVLIARSKIDQTGEAQLRDMEQLGAKVTFLQADVSDSQQVERVLQFISNNLPPLRGIIHSAGVLDDGVLSHQNWERFHRVLSPKVDGGWNLHALTLNQPLDFFVLFSSAASLLGSPGQANHSAANAFLDALAHYRRSVGLPAVSINWGAWSVVGAAARPSIRARLATHGMGTISPDQGLRILEYLLSNSSVQVGVMPIEWPTVLRQFPRHTQPPFFAVIADEERRRPNSHARAGETILLRPKDSAAIQSYLRERVATCLRLPTPQVSLHKPLSYMGLDSLMAIEIRNRVKSEIEIEVPIVKFMEGLSIAELAQEITKSMTELSSAAINGVSQSRVDISPLITPEAARQLLETVDQLSEDQIDEMLLAASSRYEGGSQEWQRSRRTAG